MIKGKHHWGTEFHVRQIMILYLFTFSFHKENKKQHPVVDVTGDRSKV